MHFHKSLVITFSALAFFSFSCTKSEEKHVSQAPVIKEKPLPEVTLERIDLWLDISGKLGDYIRRFSLENEEVRDKRDLLLLVHSSTRNQHAYTKIFSELHMSTKEFWNILDEMKRARKYLELKEDEASQNLRLEALIEAGIDELRLLEKKLDAGVGPEERARINATIENIKAKLEEFKGLSSDVSSQSVGMKEDMISLWREKGEVLEAALASMWKIDNNKKVEIYKHF